MDITRSMERLIRYPLNIWLRIITRSLSSKRMSRPTWKSEDTSSKKHHYDSPIKCIIYTTIKEDKYKDGHLFLDLLRGSFLELVLLLLAVTTKSSSFYYLYAFFRISSKDWFMWEEEDLSGISAIYYILRSIVFPGVLTKTFSEGIYSFMVLSWEDSITGFDLLLFLLYETCGLVFYFILFGSVGGGFSLTIGSLLDILYLKYFVKSRGGTI